MRIEVECEVPSLLWQATEEFSKVCEGVWGRCSVSCLFLPLGERILGSGFEFVGVYSRVRIVFDNGIDRLESCTFRLALRLFAQRGRHYELERVEQLRVETEGSRLAEDVRTYDRRGYGKGEAGRREKSGVLNRISLKWPPLRRKTHSFDRFY